jgi:hypothetical protein
MAPLTESSNVTGNDSKTGQGKRLLKTRECSRRLACAEALTVEVLRLWAEGVQNLDIFGAGMTRRSHALEGLALPVAEAFA